MRIILASQSSFKRKALDILGLDYETIPSDFDEKTIRNEDPYELAKLLSEAKAESIGKNEPDAIVIAGDLFVVFDGRIYEKPSDESEAFEMLKSFSGKWVDIIAGVAVYNTNSKKVKSSVGKCSARFRKLNDYEIGDYISRYPVLKVSAAFEGDGLMRFAEQSKGDFSFLTGLPLNELILLLRENGLKV